MAVLSHDDKLSLSRNLWVYFGRNFERGKPWKIYPGTANLEKDKNTIGSYNLASAENIDKSVTFSANNTRGISFCILTLVFVQMMFAICYSDLFDRFVVSTITNGETGLQVYTSDPQILTIHQFGD
ncbi:hypothetical protein [Pseudopelagicola sp. nBUS_19]|uniref:hypothetical protein n=1 Tax=Pseudopelagicola sp. nBUS_19 TaxID=3395316 RepID=UPI003EBDBA05